jgi:hypothetical protein
MLCAGAVALFNPSTSGTSSTRGGVDRTLHFGSHRRGGRKQASSTRSQPVLLLRFNQFPRQEVPLLACAGLAGPHITHQCLTSTGRLAPAPCCGMRASHAGIRQGAPEKKKKTPTEVGGCFFWALLAQKSTLSCFSPPGPHELLLAADGHALPQIHHSLNQSTVRVQWGH